MNIALIYSYSILYLVCVFTVTVCYSVGQFVIQILKAVNKELIYISLTIYGVFLFTVPVWYSVVQFVI